MFVLKHHINKQKFSDPVSGIHHIVHVQSAAGYSVPTCITRLEAYSPDIHVNNHLIIKPHI